jgi:hypothetical protein
MTRWIVLGLMALAACAPTQQPPVVPSRRHPITTLPPGPDLPNPTARDVVRAEAVERIETRTDVVSPTTPVAIGFCSSTTHWSLLPPDDQWFAVKIDGVQQNWGGPLEADPLAGQNCVKTQPFYRFPAGSHTVTVQLVYPASIGASGTPDCVAGQDCYGAPSDPLAAISLRVLTGPPPAIVNGHVLR